MKKLSSVDVLVCRCFGLSTLWLVDVSVCRRFGLSMFWSVDVLACRRFGLSTFWSVHVLVCRRFGLSTFRFVDVLVCRRFGLLTFWFVDFSGCRRFGLSTFWLSTSRFVDVLTSNRPIYNNPTLVQIMAWRWVGAKPLSEPMLTWFTDTYIWGTRGRSIKKIQLPIPWYYSRILTNQNILFLRDIHTKSWYGHAGVLDDFICL